MRKMKTGKAMDSNDISSEHFKLATEEIIPTIVKIVNKIFMDKDVTENMKTGILTCHEKEQRWQLTRKL
jgi:hypothetical protein